MLLLIKLIKYNIFLYIVKTKIDKNIQIKNSLFYF